MHIWNGCNALNIAWIPMKDINAKLTFLQISIKSWKMIDSLVLTSGGNFGNSHLKFACSLQWCMQICHKAVAHELRDHVKMFHLLIFYLVNAHLGNGCNALDIAGNSHERYQCQTYISQISIKSWKMIDPSASDQDLTWKLFSSDLAWTWWKMIDPWVLTSGGNLLNVHFWNVLSNDAYLILP